MTAVKLMLMYHKSKSNNKLISKENNHQTGKVFVSEGIRKVLPIKVRKIIIDHNRKLNLKPLETLEKETLINERNTQHNQDQMIDDKDNEVIQENDPISP